MDCFDRLFQIIHGHPGFIVAYYYIGPQAVYQRDFKTSQ
jgi:hypothetical protein